MSKIAGEILKMAKYILSDERLSFRYQDIGHGEGAVIWWVGNDGKIKTHESTGKETHHDLNKRMDMDLRWRGRLEPSTGRATMLPPVRLYSREPEDIPLPGGIVRVLEGMGARSILMDTQYGMRRVAKGKK